MNVQDTAVRHDAMRIGGEKITTADVVEVRYPYTDQVIGTVPAGQASELLVAVPPQHPDMQIEPERVGHPIKQSTAPVAATASVIAPEMQPPAGSTPVTQPIATPPTSSPQPLSPQPPPNYAPPATPVSGSSTPVSDSSVPAHQPTERFNRGMNRPGVSRHLNNRRRR